MFFLLLCVLPSLFVFLWLICIFPRSAGYFFPIDVYLFPLLGRISPAAGARVLLVALNHKVISYIGIESDR